MDLKEIQNLIKFVARSGASEVHLETEEFTITIKTSPDAVHYEAMGALPAPPPMVVPVISGAPAAAQSPVGTAPIASTPVSVSASSEEDMSRYVAVKSPMIGTVYRRPSPDKDPFVTVGTEIKQGDVVCIIEAMKLFNEIESEISGKVVKVLIDDQTPVEYDQPLFLIDPS
ncbi:acetyl-CoA carboxylase biotin carboxyl carrier protein [bacterium]|nr:acetyl-CoA carboxylase biotin carboxyl carrier protein [bacterium]